VTASTQSYGSAAEFMTTGIEKRRHKRRVGGWH